MLCRFKGISPRICKRTTVIIISNFVLNSKKSRFLTDFFIITNQKTYALNP